MIPMCFKAGSRDVHVRSTGEGWRWFRRTAALIGSALLLPVSLLAQQVTNAPARGHSSSPRAPVRSPSPRPGPQPPPAPPAMKSPVEFFRELLAMNGAERQAALTNRSPESRKVILAKLREYASLNSDERELRLQVTELRWYLWPLMNVPPTNRPAELAGIPPAFRPLVERRLSEWDKLSPDVRGKLLENEATIRYFTEIQDLSNERKQRVLETLTPAQRRKLEEGIDKWNKLGDAERQQLAVDFNQFFNLTEPERERALRTLSVPERRQIEKALQTFGRLPAAERARCLSSFEKFANLSLFQRQQFLQNAARWRLMTPVERQAWRELVTKVSPPLPPDLPPLPATTRSTQPSPAMATNGN